MIYFEEAQKIWNEEVPARGQASTIRGELIRSIEKLRDEAHRNGNDNWAKKSGHDMLVEYIRETLIDSRIFSDEKMTEINQDLKQISNYEYPETSDEPYDRLTDRAIEWTKSQSEVLVHDYNPRLPI